MAFCTQCGSKLEEGATFCTSCGARQEEGAPVETSVAIEVEEPVEAKEPEPPAEPVAKAAAPQMAQVAAPAASEAAQAMEAQPKSASAAAAAPDSPSEQKKPPTALIAGIVAAVAVVVACVCIFLLISQDKPVPSSEQAPVDTAEVVEVEAISSASSASDAAGNVEAVDILAGDYVLPDSATHAYSVAELAGLSDYELFVARNEIFARHGRKFQREELQQHFGSKSWYHPTISPEAFSDSVLNATEKKNIETIKSIEESHGSPYLA